MNNILKTTFLYISDTMGSLSQTFKQFSTFKNPYRSIFNTVLLQKLEINPFLI